MAGGLQKRVDFFLSRSPGSSALWPLCQEKTCRRMTSWMERAFNRTFAERLARIVDEIERIQSETDRQALQVGDRALIERSLKIMREEAQRLLQFSADSDLDPTKQ
jgi:hypothetical protein